MSHETLKTTRSMNAQNLGGLDAEEHGGLAKAPSVVVRRLAGIDDRSSGGKTAQSPTKSTWLEAWNDPVAGINAYTPCMLTCNLYGDGDWKLVIADTDRKLKVWAGTQKQSDHALLDTPIAIASFISDSSGARQPSLAVAAGPHIFIYRNLRPYYKFVVPPEDVNTEEQECWQKVMAGDMVVGEAVAILTKLQDAGVLLTTRSLQLMNIGDPEKKLTFIEQWQGQPLVAATVITCMEVIKQSVNEPDAVSCLVIGTESGRVLILNPAGTSIIKNVWLGATPAFIAVQGEVDVDYRITAAGRDGRVYNIRNGELQSSIIQLEAPAVGLVHMSASNILVACMNECVHSYKPNGHKNYSIYVPAPILTVQKVEIAAARMTRALLLALKNGEVRLYSEKQLVCSYSLPSPVTGMWFGKYGREDNTLLTVTRSGMLDIKILPRAAALEPGGPPTAPPEQDIPLQVPKKTRLYVEQTQREREQAVDMHRVFQRDLARLRLTTARAYVKVLTDGQGATAFTSSTSLTLNLAAHGLGPRFKLIITVRNDSTTHARDVPLLLSAPERIYKLSKKLIHLPLLVPSLTYTFEVPIECLDPTSAPDTITVMVLSKGSALPLLQAQLRMPVSEIDE